ncbi:hypothetical protein [Frigoriglobus tundricola]|uniref:Uncharacterized protein n=1 Tax=Frigoriglobus tundricola TaxID=2774151 RepID=A0A6M5Z4B1_9BACT|nr:hypothetical protein [Frigoriglobus tundricola]QJX01248.1 hypothetical protein FTUN_8887 [Frigoriglobus tundricola]
MPMVIQIRKDWSGPVIVCDHCNRPIASADDGNLLWQEPEPGRPTPPAFTHKACFTAFECARPGFWYTADLDTAMVYLANNLRMTDAVRKRAEGKARLLATL